LIFGGEIKPGQREYTKKFMAVFPDVLRELSRHFGEQRVLRFHLTTEKINQVDVTILKRRYDTSDDQSLCYAVLENHVVITIGKKTMQGLTSRYSGMPLATLAENEDFKKNYEELNCKEVFWYVNNENIIDRMLESFKASDEDIPAALQALTVMGLRTSAGGSSFSGKNIIDDVLSFFSTERTEKSLDFMEGTRCHFSATDSMPDNALVYYTFPFPLQKMYDSFEEQKHDLLEPLKLIEESLNISVKDDILPRLGKELEFCFQMNGFIPDSLWSLRIKSNPDDIALFLQTLPYIYPNVFDESVYEEHKMYLIKGKGLATFALAQAAMVYEDKLMVGSIIALQNVINGVENKLSESGKFIKAKAIVNSNTNGFLYVDTKEALVLVKGFLMNMIARALAGDDFDYTKIPSDEILEESTVPFSAMIAVTKNKMEFKSKGFLSVTAFFGIAMVRLIRTNFESITYMANKRKKQRDERRKRFKKEAEERKKKEKEEEEKKE